MNSISLVLDHFQFRWLNQRYRSLELSQIDKNGIKWNLKKILEERWSRLK